MTGTRFHLFGLAIAMFLRANFYGDCNIGLYGFASERYVFLGLNTKMDKKIEEVLGTKKLSSTVLYTSFAGIFCAGNSHGIIAPKILEEYELERLKNIFEHVLVLDTDYSAIGNLVLLNDNGIVISPMLRKHRKEVHEFFRLPCEVGRIAGVNVVGAMAIAVNNGCLASPRTKKNEIKLLEEVLDVELGLGTVGFGSPFVRSGIIANSRGFLASDTSSGPELGRISEALGF